MRDKTVTRDVFRLGFASRRVGLSARRGWETTTTITVEEKKNNKTKVGKIAVV